MPTAPTKTLNVTAARPDSLVLHGVRRGDALRRVVGQQATQQVEARLRECGAAAEGAGEARAQLAGLRAEHNLRWEREAGGREGICSG
mgnify:CR=1 FL=1